MAALSDDDARALTSCLAGGGVALFPADTVYGLACDPDDEQAIARLYALKGRPERQPAAVMFFDVTLALADLPELGPALRRVLTQLLPGPVTLLVPNPAERHPLACGDDPRTLGLRVPALTGNLEALRQVGRPLLQSSANPSGAAEARRLQDVEPSLRARADLVLDGGTLPGRPSTVVDLRRWEALGEWAITRAGAVAAGELERTLGPSDRAAGLPP